MPCFILGMNLFVHLSFKFMYIVHFNEVFALTGTYKRRQPMMAPVHISN